MLSIYEADRPAAQRKITTLTDYLYSMVFEGACVLG